MTKDEALKLALSKIKSARDCHPNAVQTLIWEAEEILEQALAAPVQEPVGTLNIWFYKGHGNYDFEYWGSLGEGTHTVHVAKSEAPSHNSTCNETLRAQGKAYPRTCKKCGLGPCVGKPKPDTTPPAAPVREPVPEGMVLMPKRMTQAMSDVTDQEDWIWEDLLAAAETITEDEYNKIATAAQPAPVQEPSLTDLAAAIEYADARWSGVDVPIEWARHFADAIGKLYTTQPAAHQTEPQIIPQAIPRMPQDHSSTVPDGNSGPICEGWNINFSNGHSGFGVYAHMDEYPEEGAILLCGVPKWASDALKAAPPAAQRQWVGLTDEDIWNDDKIMGLNANTGLYMDELVGIARAIEAKLKEKNGM